jgi:Fic-DOC domain mobile mystery protein B
VALMFETIAGQTPLDPDESAGLKPRHISLQAHLNEWEQANILKAQRWAFRLKGVGILTEGFVRDLHRRMFDDTWRWAGTFRNTDKTIGAPWEQIAVRLDQLLKNTAAQIEFKAFPARELAIRFHHGLVWIHPFPNGNGRHSRMMADILAIRLGTDRFTWGKANLYSAGTPRADYIAALQAADRGDFAPLLAFATG